MLGLQVHLSVYCYILVIVNCFQQFATYQCHKAWCLSLWERLSSRDSTNAELERLLFVAGKPLPRRSRCQYKAFRILRLISSRSRDNLITSLAVSDFFR